jgi:epoxide hydrolase
VEVPDRDVTDLRIRLVATRWPDELSGGWERAVPPSYLRSMAAHWADGFDWRAVEARLNGVAQFVTKIDGQRIHFLHVRSPEPGALALIATHGYPGSVVEFLAILGPLTDPAAHGGDRADTFHLAVPSLPGFGFSAPVRHVGWGLGRTTRAVAEMMGRLGYDRDGAHGADIGAGVSEMLGAVAAEHVVGVHLATDPTAIALIDGLVPDEWGRLPLASSGVTTRRPCTSGRFLFHLQFEEER